RVQASRARSRAIFKCVGVGRCLMWGHVSALGIAAIAALTLDVIEHRHASAETLPAVLAKAYRNNPQLNVQRGFVRQTQEQVNVAMSGYQPRIAATASAGGQYTDSKFSGADTRRDRVATGSVGVTASQTLFDGFRTPNQVQASEGNVQAAREMLRL